MITQGGVKICRVFGGAATETLAGIVEGFLLVDDRDGRVILEIGNPLQALRLLDELEQDEPELAQNLSLVRLDGHEAALIGTDTTMRIQSLT